MSIENFSGLDDLRQWLRDRDFKISGESQDKNQLVNWYAFRRSSIPARECETNDGKPMQIVVRPHHLKFEPFEFKSVEVEVTGEAGGIWFKLMAYSMSESEFKDRFESVERSLIAAWNVLIVEESAQ